MDLNKFINEEVKKLLREYKEKTSIEFTRDSNGETYTVIGSAEYEEGDESTGLRSGYGSVNIDSVKDSNGNEVPDFWDFFTEDEMKEMYSDLENEFSNMGNYEEDEFDRADAAYDDYRDSLYENKSNSLTNFIKEEVSKLHKTTLLENKKSQIEKELNMLEEDCVGEGKRIESYRHKHSTLSSAVDEARQYAINRGYTPNEDDIWKNFGTGGMGYGEKKRASIEIEKDGKVQRKYLQISINRMGEGSDIGDYEMDCYIN